jgi:hypothetical protein
MVNSEHEKNRLNDVWRTNQVNFDDLNETTINITIATQKHK